MTPWKINPTPMAATKKADDACHRIDAVRSNIAYDCVGVGKDQIVL